ncbi:MAG: hypothetical protein ACRD12_09435, partial [Acidimicrobiales bacterium]
LIAGAGAGVLVAGGGGRLVMRLLAVTAGDSAQGQITEAEEVVGRITVGGTIGFIVFAGVFFGFASGAVYLLIHQWLPSGRLGGLLYGGLLWAVAATRMEPLRADNPDFFIVGPGWLSVLAFSTVVLLHGMLVVALASRLSRSLPLIAPKLRAILAYSPLLILFPIVAAVLTLVGAVVVVVTRIPGVVRGWRAIARQRLAARLVLVGVVLVALPGFVSSLLDIVTDSA